MGEALNRLGRRREDERLHRLARAPRRDRNRRERRTAGLVAVQHVIGSSGRAAVEQGADIGLQSLRQPQQRCDRWHFQVPFNQREVAAREPAMPGERRQGHTLRQPNPAKTLPQPLICRVRHEVRIVVEALSLVRFK